MPIFRAVYIRDGRPHGMTFGASCPPMAAQFAYTVLQPFIKSIGGGDILTVNSVAKRSKQLDSQSHSRSNLEHAVSE